MDNTDPEAKLDVKPGEDDSTTRWKFKGPWVAGMTQGHFDAWVTKELKKRKPEFMAFLREHRIQQLKKERRKAAREAGTDVTAVESNELSERELADYLRTLRQDYNLASELAGLINAFLDLPSIPTAPGRRSNFLTQYEATEKPPPSTHPSAGLTYVRSDAFLNNHPIFGPQARQEPVEARILAGSRTQASPASIQSSQKTSANQLSDTGVCRKGISLESYLHVHDNFCFAFFLHPPTSCLQALLIVSAECVVMIFCREVVPLLLRSSRSHARWSRHPLSAGTSRTVRKTPWPVLLRSLLRNSHNVDGDGVELQILSAHISQTSHTSQIVVTYTHRLKQVLSLLVDIELTALRVLSEIEGRNFGHVLVLALALLFLQLEGDAADGAALDALH